MNLKMLLLLCVLLPAATFGQSIKSPLVGSSDGYNTTITEVETNSRNTVISFRHICREKDGWVQLNKSIYLQDADGEERYNYVKSEGIPLRPEKLTATENNQVVNFKVYFEKLKPGTKAINVIERARSLAEMADGITYFNFYKIDLNKSMPVQDQNIRNVEVVMSPPPPMDMREGVDTAVSMGSTFGPSMNGMMTNLGPMMGNMYTSMLNAQLKVYSDPAITTQLAKITKNYYDALVKAGFSSDAALKIITSKQLVSVEGAK